MKSSQLVPGLPVVLQLPDAALEGEVVLPAGATGIVVFVHGSGSSRISPRNQQVARHFNALGLGTLLFDLLTAEEHRVDEATREFRFDIPMLARRMVAVLELNRGTARLLKSVHRLEVVPGATHLFEEPGTLDIVAGLAGDWFVKYLR